MAFDRQGVTSCNTNILSPPSVTSSNSSILSLPSVSADACPSCLHHPNPCPHHGQSPSSALRCSDGGTELNHLPSFCLPAVIHNTAVIFVGVPSLLHDELIARDHNRPRCLLRTSEGNVPLAPRPTHPRTELLGLHPHLGLMQQQSEPPAGSKSPGERRDFRV